jgi:hypothetical protein|tara:strand:+ start:376 stop:555 length:180 start_codon:yes stop_codon:yes gene_type:complete
MTEVLKNSVLFEFQTEDREDALCTSPHNASTSVYIICSTAAVPAIIKTDEEKYYFEVGV